jgi:hypothetical protein
MGHSNYEPRRFYRSRNERQRGARCTSCGGRPSSHAAHQPFCDACLDWSRQSGLDEWDELGAGD